MFVELVFFKSKPGASRAEVLESGNKISALATQLGASFKLELFQSEDGEWVEIVYWNSKEEAQRIEGMMMNMPEAQQAMSVMDEASVRMVFLNPALP